MKMNDPFGRIERRHQLGYETMRDNLLRGGIDSPQAAIEVIHQSKRRAFKIVGAAIVLAGLAALWAPDAALSVLVLLLIVIIWIINSFVNGQRYIKRFIKENLDGNPPEE